MTTTQRAADIGRRADTGRHTTTRVVTIAGHRVLVGIVRRSAGRHAAVMAEAREATALAKNTRNVAVLRRALRARGVR